MQGPSARLEVRSASGNLLFTVTVTETDSSPTLPSGDLKLIGGNGQSASHAVTKSLAQDRPKEHHASTTVLHKNGEALMTDSQKRLLFRLLAEQGIEGDKAHEHLKKQFQVDSLKEVTKLEASRTIEKLIEDTKGGKPFHAAA